jgi:hypothetical protein
VSVLSGAVGRVLTQLDAPGEASIRPFGAEVAASTHLTTSGSTSSRNFEEAFSEMSLPTAFCNLGEPP